MSKKIILHGFIAFRHLEMGVKVRYSKTTGKIKVKFDSTMCQYFDKETWRKCKRKAVSRYAGDNVPYCNVHLQEVRAKAELQGII